MYRLYRLYGLYRLSGLYGVVIICGVNGGRSVNGRKLGFFFRTVLEDKYAEKYACDAGANAV